MFCILRCKRIFCYKIIYKFVVKLCIMRFCYFQILFEKKAYSHLGLGAWHIWLSALKPHSSLFEIIFIVFINGLFDGIKPHCPNRLIDNFKLCISSIFYATCNKQGLISACLDLKVFSLKKVFFKLIFKNNSCVIFVFW